MRRCFCICFVLVLCACSSTQYQQAQTDFVAHTEKQHIEKSRYIKDVPLIAQEENQCGPASLAMLLSYKGKAVSVAELENRVYLPEAEGSLQADLIATVRQFSLVPYSKQSNFAELFTELETEQPVIVLLNLGVEKIPVWHYAVAVGVSKEDNALLLHMGKAKMEAMGLKRFEYAWRQSDYWSLSAHDPSSLPTYANPNDLVLAIAHMEELGQLEVAKAAYRSAHKIWPDNPAPLMGLGNIAYKQQEFEQALAYFTAALPLSSVPQSVELNLALTHRQLGNEKQALILLDKIKP